MSTLTSTAEYQAAIQAELGNVEDIATRRTIQELLAYAASTETEAENRELRPRPDGSENAAYYRKEINTDTLPTASLRKLIRDLLQYIENLENQS